MAKKGQQKGAQRHAEGQHGKKAHAHLIEQLQSGGSKPDLEDSAEAGDPKHDDKGKHRLFEGREQHDEADKNSEKNRLEQDIQDHGHNRENFQVRGGSASSRAMPRNPINPENPDAPTPGAEPADPPQRVPGVGGS